ncbi:hypothetical protein KO465_06525 [Candidatus Micrarchaeota archaeon]|nr:hypothetical protein [Candidatus Micrarchaeota archaeon]
MKEYNSAFFSLYENLYIVLKQELGEERALELFRKIMEKGLKKAYDSMGFEKGNPEDFVKVLKQRDESVGLKVTFPEVTDSKIIYQFHTDPFPNLKGIVDHKKFDDTYISFKVKYLLGEKWTYAPTKHIWDGDEHTEFIITKD